ncbi:hypothetical protein [uncultured Sphingomonas sp.]|uniref:hypothetical protein n=1 Tax=uncultured Sphingomonas sp. TaxID=158754 RepID=UPI0025D48977|nr:hypothetical protein [uncultured Sphingomonas sp.]
MKKLVLMTAACAFTASSAMATTVRPSMAGQTQTAPATAAPADQAATPVPTAARPTPKKKSSFFGLPLLGLLLAGGAAGAAAAATGGTASPQ